MRIEFGKFETWIFDDDGKLLETLRFGCWAYADAEIELKPDEADALAEAMQRQASVERRKAAQDESEAE